jgi:hypothetical protein
MRRTIAVNNAEKIDEQRAEAVSEETVCGKESGQKEPGKTPDKSNCGAEKSNVRAVSLVVAKTVAGVCIGSVVGLGAVVAIAAAEVTLPALLIMKTFGFAGGALGFLKGVKHK